MPNLFEENEILLSEGITLLEVLPDSLYHPAGNENLSSVGEHFRHIIEHYQMFFRECLVVTLITITEKGM